MTDQFYHPDLVRFAFVLGLVVSILFYERRHLTTGGIAVPGYVAFAVFDPLILPALLVTALTTHGLVHLGLARLVLLPSDAKFSLTILVSAGLHLVADLGLLASAGPGAGSQVLRGIGYVVPGLVAHDFARHGIARTVTSVSVTSGVVALALLVVVLTLPETARLFPGPEAEPFGISVDFFPLLVFLSLIAWLGLARVHGLRCGGFLGGAFLAIIVVQPGELLRFVATAAITLLIVRNVLDPAMILFGRRRFAAHMLVGSCLSWLTLEVSEVYLAGTTISSLAPSVALLGVLLTGLMSHDMDAGGVARTLLGATLAVTFSLAGTLLVLEAAVYQRPEVGVPLAALVLSGGVVMATDPDRLRWLAGLGRASTRNAKWQRSTNGNG